MSNPTTTNPLSASNADNSPSTLQLGGATFMLDTNGLAITVDPTTHSTPLQLDTRDAATLEQFLATHRQGEARSGFRVPFHSLIANLADDLMVTVVYRSTIYDVIPIDISLTGMLLHASKLPATAGSKVIVRIVLEDYLAKLEAEIVRIDSDSVALHFSGCMVAGELNPDRELSALFSRLERLFLQQRSR